MTISSTWWQSRSAFEVSIAETTELCRVKFPTRRVGWGVVERIFSDPLLSEWSSPTRLEIESDLGRSIIVATGLRERKNKRLDGVVMRKVKSYASLSPLERENENRHACNTVGVDDNRILQHAGAWRKELWKTILFDIRSCFDWLIHVVPNTGISLRPQGIIKRKILPRNKNCLKPSFTRNSVAWPSRQNVSQLGGFCAPSVSKKILQRSDIIRVL